MGWHFTQEFRVYDTVDNTAESIYLRPCTAVTENLAMRESHGRETTNLRHQLAAANTRAREFEIQYHQTAWPP